MDNPHDEGLRWLVTLLAIPFAGGVGWLVKHLMGRKTEYVQLGLFRAQTAEIRAKIRRENESAAVTMLQSVAGELRADVERLRDERNAAQAEAKDLREKLKQLEEILAEIQRIRDGRGRLLDQ